MLRKKSTADSHGTLRTVAKARVVPGYLSLLHQIDQTHKTIVDVTFQPAAAARTTVTSHYNRVFRKSIRTLLNLYIISILQRQYLFNRYKTIIYNNLNITL